MISHKASLNWMQKLYLSTCYQAHILLALKKHTDTFTWIFEYFFTPLSLFALPMLAYCSHPSMLEPRQNCPIPKCSITPFVTSPFPLFFLLPFQTLASQRSAFKRNFSSPLLTSDTLGVVQEAPAAQGKWQKTPADLSQQHASVISGWLITVPLALVSQDTCQGRCVCIVSYKAASVLLCSILAVC